MRFELREYQVNAVNTIRSILRTDVKGCCLQLPTGMGKTAILIELVSIFISEGKSVLFIVHSEQILRQTSDQLHFNNIGHTFLISGAVLPDVLQDNVILAMSQTLDRRVRDNKLGNIKVDLIIIDEIHRLIDQHCRTTSTFVETVGAKIVGATATPTRLDGKKISDLVPIIIEGPSIEDSIKAGYLVPLRTFRLPAMNLNKVAIRAGEFVTSDVEREFFAERLTENIVKWWEDLGCTAGWRETPASIMDDNKNKSGKVTVNGQEVASRKYRRTIVFAPSRRVSITLMRAFNQAGYKFIHIDKDTPTNVRAISLAALKENMIDGIINVRMYVEGMDVPEISCIIDVAPTLSVAKFLQVPGRGLRKSESTGKVDCIYMDFANNSDRHGKVEALRDWSNGGVTVKDPDTIVCPTCYLFSEFFNNKLEIITQCVQDKESRRIGITCEFCNTPNSASRYLAKHYNKKLSAMYSKLVKPRALPDKYSKLANSYKDITKTWNKAEEIRHSMGLSLPIAGQREGYSEQIIKAMILQLSGDVTKVSGKKLVA